MKSMYSLVSTDSHFKIWDGLDTEIQSKTQDAEEGKIQAYVNKSIKGKHLY